MFELAVVSLTRESRCVKRERDRKRETERERERKREKESERVRQIRAHHPSPNFSLYFLQFQTFTPPKIIAGFNKKKGLNMKPLSFL